MAENKKSIVVYADWIDKFEELTDEEAGKLIKHFFRYVNDMSPEAPDRTTKLMFIDIKNTLKRDLNKYSDKKEERSKSGKLGNLKKYQLDLYDKVISDDLTLNEALAIVESRKVSLSENNLAKLAVSDSVSVSDSVIISLKDKYSEVEFIERWKSARQHYLKKPYYKTKLELLDKVKLDNISDIYTKKQIDNAIKGMFSQKSILDHLLLQPTHFLELKNFEMYLTCSVSGEQVYEKKGFKKPIERI